MWIWVVKLSYAAVAKIYYELTSDKTVNCQKSIIREVKQTPKSTTGALNRSLGISGWSEKPYVLEIYKLKQWFLSCGFLRC